MLSVTPGRASKSPNTIRADRFAYSTSHSPFTTYAGCGRRPSASARTDALAALVRRGRTAVAASARRRRCARSVASRRSARAMLSRVRRDTRTGRPCSSHVYHVTLMPASIATSSRRIPAARRRGVRLPARGSARSRMRRRKAASARVGDSGESMVVPPIPGSALNLLASARAERIRGDARRGAPHHLPSSTRNRYDGAREYSPAGLHGHLRA